MAVTFQGATNEDPIVVLRYERDSEGNLEMSRPRLSRSAPGRGSVALW